jgi:threonylcarbamoyladenosine tRNA methylthiotransferase MtaB
VPSVRGRPDSVPPGDVVEEVRRRVAEGHREVVLTGTQPGSYGYDRNGAGLAGLVRRLLNDTEVQRIRVSSLQPQELSERLFGLWDDSRFCPHVHMPLQSGSDRILRSMGRGYSIDRYRRAIDVLRAGVADVAITTDVIVGFPGEGDEDAAETQQFCIEAGFARVHVFPFSARPGTRALEMSPQVPRDTVRSRTNDMIKVSQRLDQAFKRKYVGLNRPVLWEEVRDVGGTEACSGLTDNYLRVFTRSDENLVNTITPARIDKIRNGDLWAEVNGVQP